MSNVTGLRGGLHAPAGHGTTGGDGSRFRVRLWCADCTGQDSMGCFGGGAEIMCASTAPWPELTFSTVDAAKEAGYARTALTLPWGFDVINEDDEKVYSSEG